MKEQELKSELLPSIKEHGVGRVYYGSSRGAETFSRKSVLQYLRYIVIMSDDAKVAHMIKVWNAPWAVFCAFLIFGAGRHR